MKLLNIPLLFLLIILFSCDKEEFNIGKQVPVSFTSVHITDKFWSPKIETNRTVSIPSAFKQCEINGRIDNFALAGGKISGEHKGDFPFDDTDVYKIIEGASYSLEVKYDKILDNYLDSIISLIGIAQEDDGYLYTCITNKCERLRPWYGKGKWDRINSHELYNCGHLYEAAIAHYQATGKRNLLDIAIKNADLIDKVFGPGEGQKKVPSGHPIVEMALVKLYRITGEERYLNLAKFFIDETGKGSDGHKLNQYSQDHMPIVNQEEAVGHAVRLGYLYSGVTDVASLLNDSTLLEASKRVWNNVVSKKLYITGGIGSRSQGEGFGSNYELNNMTAYCETCASISNVYWNYRLFLSDPKSAYYDVLERVLYNGVISGVSLSGDKFFYDNPLESDSTHERAPWFGCACCPGNVTRFMASIPGYVYTTGAKTIMINLFVDNDAKIPLGNDTVLISQHTDYPWNGKIEIEVSDPGSGNFNLMTRIPGWAKNEVVPSDLYTFYENKSDPIDFKINGKKKNPEIKNGYAIFSKKWKKGDKIEISIPLDVQKISANKKVESDIDKKAYQRGPLVYCFEDKDNNGEWMFDVIIPDTSKALVKEENDKLGGIVSFSIDGFKIEKSSTDVKKIPVKLNAIPYFAWNNRGASNMIVWVPDREENTYSKGDKGKEAEATPTSSSGWAPGLNDGFTPKKSSDIDKHFFTWWNKHDKNNWVQYDFINPVELRQSKVYWLNTLHYEGNYTAPKSWNLQYKNKKGSWFNVETSDNYGVSLNDFNTITFKEIITTAVRMNVEFQADYSSGILEWKLY
ncbi:MAG: glycoside hydrolase family 127 protein [Prolixibacteraceae bacterium]|nr:glycoside hydrolase family 127 protein [Prolixibacteraceae bacterium]